MRTRYGTKHLPTSRNFSPYARPMAMTGQQTADLRAQHTSETTHPLAASSQPTPRVTSHATSTSRALRNHLRRLGNNTLWTPPRAHPYHRPSIPSRFSKPNSQNNASRYRMSSAVVMAAATAKAKAVAVTPVIGTKPHGKRKNSALTATRRLPMTPRIVSPSRQKDKRPKGWGTKHGN